jgi:2-polyprenyl-3-methyl-5-hydroxy-6-metoxy-1,4-benzoquinol methylase
MKRLAISDQDVVIDASCGCGYGSCGLARKAGRVYGLDVNESYLQIAKDNLKLPNLIFLTYEEYRNGDWDKADKIVCIETFEHIPKEQGIFFLTRLVGYLRNTGSMFLTTPLGDDGPSTYNPFHCFEPSIGTLRTLLFSFFGNVDMEIDTFTNSFGHVCEFASVVLRNKK